MKRENRGGFVNLINLRLLSVISEIKGSDVLLGVEFASPHRRIKIAASTPRLSSAVFRAALHFQPAIQQPAFDFTHFENRSAPLSPALSLSRVLCFVHCPMHIRVLVLLQYNVQCTNCRQLTTLPVRRASLLELHLHNIILVRWARPSFREA